jgi:phosphate transport system substrate-binding protein
VKTAKLAHICAVSVLALPLWSCSQHPATASGSHSSETGVPPSVIRIDGSSTVYPITEAVAEEFQKSTGARITISISGTGGGFKRLCAGEVAIIGASRPIKLSEQQACAASQLEFVELPIAYDGLAVVVNPQNLWVRSMSLRELRRIWEPAAQKKVLSWNHIRPEWPELPLHLFGAGVDSGTYDYFTKAVIGQEHQSRGDFTSSEDDNVLVQGVSRDVSALGFFSLAYYEENRDKLKLVPVDDGEPQNGDGPIAPSRSTVSNGTYQPLSRPIFVYVSKAALAQPEVVALLEFYLDNAPALVKEARYVPLPESAYALVHKRLKAGKVGSVFAGRGSEIGVTVEGLLAHE